MSQFLPDDFGKQNSDYLKAPVSEAGNLSRSDQQLWRKLNASVTDITPEFKAWLVDFILVNVVPQIPVSQLSGFRSFTSTHDEIPNAETISSTTYTDLATVGPQLTDLSDGSYSFLFGCNYSSSAGGDGYMALSVNGAAPSDALAAYIRPSVANRYNLVRGVEMTIKSGAANTVKAQYRVSSGTNGFESRWLIGQRTGNA